MRAFGQRPSCATPLDQSGIDGRRLPHDQAPAAGMATAARGPRNFALQGRKFADNTRSGMQKD
jgi:hypothetical protein